MNNLLDYTDDRELPSSVELMNILETVRETNRKAYANVLRTISHMRLMLLVREAEAAYQNEDVSRHHIYEVHAERAIEFGRYIGGPAHDARYTVLLRTDGGFAMVIADDWTTRNTILRMYTLSTNRILHMMSTFGNDLIPQQSLYSGIGE